jgi:hypothetical protein
MPGRCNCEQITPSPSGLLVSEDLQHFQWLARESAWIVSSGGTSKGDVREILRQAFIDHGFSKGSLMDFNKLTDALERRFSSSFLDSIGRPARKGRTPAAWVRKAFYNHNQQKKVQTLQTILLIGVAFDSVETFEKTDASRPSTPNVTPLPDLKENKYSVSVADVLKVVATMAKEGISLDSAAKLHGHPRKELISVARENHIRVPLAGRFPLILGEQNLEHIREMLRKGIPKTVIFESTSCGEYGLTLIELDDPSLNRLHYEAAREQTRTRNREKVLIYMSENPGCSRTDIQINLIGAYEYMLEYDNDWFYQQFPARKERQQEPPTRKKRRPENLDRDKAVELEKLFDSIASAEGMPVWISAHAALKRVGIFSIFTRDESQFPLVKEVLERRLEKIESYRERRIRWGVAVMAKSGTPFPLTS